MHHAHSLKAVKAIKQHAAVAGKVKVSSRAVWVNSLMSMRKLARSVPVLTNNAATALAKLHLSSMHVRNKGSLSKGGVMAAVYKNPPHRRATKAPMEVRSSRARRPHPGAGMRSQRSLSCVCDVQSQSWVAAGAYSSAGGPAAAARCCNNWVSLPILLLLALALISRD